MTRPQEELGAKVRRLQNAVTEVNGHATIDGITIRTDANGRLTGIEIDPRAHAAGPQAVAESIMRAYTAVSEDTRARTRAILAELRDDPAVARIADATVTDPSTPPPAQHVPAYQPPPQHQPAPAPRYQPDYQQPNSGWSTHGPARQSTAEPVDANPDWIAERAARARAARQQAEPDRTGYYGVHDAHQSAPAMFQAPASTPAPKNEPFYDEDDEDDEDAYYQRKSWLI